MKDYQKMYEERLKKQKESVLDSNVNDQLEIKALGNRKIETLTDAMSKIVGKKVWEDFNFRTGKIFGILRFMAQNPTHRQQLLEVTGLKQDHVDMYFKYCGNLPYVNTTDNTVNMGKHMDVSATKDLIKIIAAQLEIVVEDEDLSDITEERWTRLYNSALERAKETMAFNEQNNPDTASKQPTEYSDD